MLTSGFLPVSLGLRVLAMYGFKLWALIFMLAAGAVALTLAMVRPRFPHSHFPLLTTSHGQWSIIKFGDPGILSAPGMPGCHTARTRPA